MRPLERRLNDLIIDGVIKNYILSTISGEGKVGEFSPDGCNYERLTIVFNNGESITMSTACSGCLENTSLWLEE